MKADIVFSSPLTVYLKKYISDMIEAISLL